MERWNDTLSLIQSRVVELDERLKSATGILGSCELHLIGALKTGLFFGPKRKQLSFNPDCPFPAVIEADLKLILPADLNPHDDQIIEAVAAAFQPDFTPRRRQFYHWDRTDISTTHFYRYDPLETGMGLEWELALNRKPYVEISLFWDKLFTPAEINWQRAMRQNVAELDVTVEDYMAFKNRQNTEARWRLVAGYALGKLGQTMNDLPSIFTHQLPENPVARLVEKWLAGESGYRTMERPTDLGPESVIEKLREGLSVPVFDKLVEPPPVPDWVCRAADIQSQLKRNAVRPCVFRKECGERPAP
jgi:hypothetical protein